MGNLALEGESRDGGLRVGGVGDDKRRLWLSEGTQEFGLDLDRCPSEDVLLFNGATSVFAKL